MNTVPVNTATSTLQDQGSSRWFMASGFLIVITFFLGAVFTAGWTVNVAYRSSQLSAREKVALSQQKVLKERLAQLSSLQTTLTYAQERGYIATTTTDSLEVSTPVAQNTLVQ